MAKPDVRIIPATALVSLNFFGEKLSAAKLIVPGEIIEVTETLTDPKTGAEATVVSGSGRMPLPDAKFVDELVFRTGLLSDDLSATNVTVFRSTPD